MAESIITKRAIADSLKEITLYKSFDKITIKDITDKCGINRQTFYYHFVDKYDLLQWIYQVDFFDTYLADMDFDNWYEKMVEGLESLKAEKKFYINTANHAESFILNFVLEKTQEIFEKAVDKLDENRVVEKGQREFIARFFSFGVCGVIIEWASGGMQEEPVFLVDNMRKMLILSERAANEHIFDDLH